MIRDATHGTCESRTEEMRPLVGETTDAHVESRVEGLVLAGVHSWGGDVLEAAACKLALPVALRPLISYSVDWLRLGLVCRPCICANSETRELQRCLGTDRTTSEKLTYYEDRMPRGPAGCVRDAAARMSGDTIVVVEGTVLPRFDLGALLGAHFRTEASLTVVVEEAAGDAQSRGAKPAGVYVFSKDALSAISPVGYQDIKEVLIPKLHSAGHRVATHAVPPASVLRVACADSYLDVNMDVVCRVVKSGQAPKGFARMGSAWVHESTKIEAGAQLKGPLLIGPDCRISADALLIGPTVLGRGCVIDSGVVLTRSVLWDRCSVGWGAILDRSILTSGTTIDPEIVARHAVFVGGQSPRSR